MRCNVPVVVALSLLLSCELSWLLYHNSCRPHFTPHAAVCLSLAYHGTAASPTRVPPCPLHVPHAFDSPARCSHRWYVVLEPVRGRGCHTWCTDPLCFLPLRALCLLRWRCHTVHCPAICQPRWSSTPSNHPLTSFACVVVDCANATDAPAAVCADGFASWPLRRLLPLGRTPTLWQRYLGRALTT